MLTVLTLVVSLNALQGQDNRELMNIAGDNITVQEFLNIYNKNNTNNVVDKKTMDEYLDLFINFKLKVKEAEALGMDTARKFVSELAGYRRQLAQPYLVDRDLNEQLVREAFDRMKQDVAAYHILIRVADDAAAADTLKALTRVRELRKDVNSEKDMQRLITTMQNDGDDNTIGEDLGYFTAFAMVYPFESAAYNTPVGSVSEPVRTRFGYHLIFVKDKRPARGEVRVSHIMIKSTEDMLDDAREAARARIYEIHERLQKGESFDNLANEYSEDKATAPKGGKLPWFGTGRMVSSFEDAAFALQHDGDISEPVQTPYGWHIIKRDEYKGVGEFDEVKNSIRKRIERDARGLQGRTSLLKKLKEEYAFTYNNKNKGAANKFVGSEYLQGTWKLESAKPLDAPVLTITDNVYSKRTVTYTQQDYLEYLQRTQRPRGEKEMLSQVLSEQWDAFVNAMIIQFEDENLEHKYPEFKALMQEYHDGILLFDLMDQKVWSKAVKDSAGLEQYYEGHKQDFMWGERVDASVYVCANEDIKKQTLKMAKKREKKGYTDSAILTEVNSSNPLNLSIRSGLYARDEDENIDAAPWEPGIHEINAAGDKKVLVQIYKVLEPQPKSLSEARGLVTSAYQNHLEEQWIKELRGKYDFRVNQEVFDSIKN